MGQTKRQHYVPRSYLERFANPATGNVSVFDKFTRRTFETNVWNIAQERYFYDLQPESVKDEYRNTGIDLQAVEKGLAVTEGYFARALDALLDGVERRGIPPPLRWMLAIQIAIQWTRTKLYRETIVELSEKSIQAFADDLVSRNFPDLPRDHYPKVGLKEHGVSALHNQHFFNREHWERLASVFVRHIWLVGVNKSPIFFYTSDHPVVRRANLPDQRSGGIGIDSPGVEFFIPLSPEYALILLERSFFRDWEEVDGGVVGINPEAVKGYNRLQVARSYRHVFSSVRDFRTAASVCEDDPSVCDPNRKRVEVTVTQVGPFKSRFEARVFD